MTKKALNKSLHTAKATKQDEFYTQLTDIEKELRHYTAHFADKIVLCNCDDPRVSNFFHYFSHNFERLKLKKLITTCYKNNNADLFSQHDFEQGKYLVYEGDKDGDRLPGPNETAILDLEGDGDFRSAECVELLRQADIVVTNPPFSLFREYVAQLIEHKKKFLIVGNQNAVTYKEVFPLIMGGKLWLGHNSGDMKFQVPDHYEARGTRYWVDDGGQKWRSLGNACWFTNLDITKRHEDIVLYKNYDPQSYPSYDNYDAIEVNKALEIPVDYPGVMGVPLTFLDRHNPNQFEIIGVTQSWSDGRIKTYPTQIQVGADGSRSNVTKLNDGAALKLDSPPRNATYYMVDGEYYMKVYARILIRRKR